MNGGTVQPVEAGSDVTRDPRPAVERLSTYIRNNNHPLHHASAFVLEDALEACGLTLVPPAVLEALVAFEKQWNACGPNSDFGRHFKNVREAAVAALAEAQVSA